MGQGWSKDPAPLAFHSPPPKMKMHGGLLFGNTGNVEQAGIALRSLFCGSPPPKAASEVSG